MSGSSVTVLSPTVARAQSTEATTTAGVGTSTSTSTTTSATTPATLYPAATNPPGTGMPTPSVYVGIALDFMQQYAYKVPFVDWATIRVEAEARAAKAATIEDAYGVILFALKGLADRHSSFNRPPEAVKQTEGKYSGYGFLAVWPSRVVVTVTTGSPSEKAGLKVGDRIDKVDGKTPKGSNGALTITRTKDGSFPDQVVLTVVRKGVKKARLITIKAGDVTLVSTPTAKPLTGRRLGNGAGYLDVPGIIGDDATQASYAQQLQDAIRSADGPSPRCGWIVDLRRNRGGYIYAMLAGLGPILGEGVVAGQRDAKGRISSWSYSGGTAMVDGQRAVTVGNPYRTMLADPPVAVLISNLTASAGEATAIAFRGVPRFRSFGVGTVGLTTFNIRRTMPDGAFVNVMSGVDVDRTGTGYEAGIAPDVTVAIDWNHVGDDADPVLNEAARWLDQQPSCAAAARR